MTTFETKYKKIISPLPNKKIYLKSQNKAKKLEKFQNFLVSLNLSNPSLFNNESRFYYRPCSSKQIKLVNKISEMDSTKNTSEINQQNENMNGMNFQVK